MKLNPPLKLDKRESHDFNCRDAFGILICILGFYLPFCFFYERIFTPINRNNRKILKRYLEEHGDNLVVDSNSSRFGSNEDYYLVFLTADGFQISLSGEWGYGVFTDKDGCVLTDLGLDFMSRKEAKEVGELLKKIKNRIYNAQHG